MNISCESLFRASRSLFLGHCKPSQGLLLRERERETSSLVRAIYGLRPHWVTTYNRASARATNQCLCVCVCVSTKQKTHALMQSSDVLLHPLFLSVNITLPLSALTVTNLLKLTCWNLILTSDPGRAGSVHWEISDPSLNLTSSEIYESLFLPQNLKTKI